MAETAISVYSHMTGEMECNAAKKMDDALGRVTRYFYDQKKGHLLAVISPDGNGTSHTYDSLGRMTLAVPAKVNSSGTGYTSVTGSAKASYGYNSSGQPSSVLTGLSGYSFSYDIFGNTSSVGWESASIASYTYNPGNGKLASMTYASGVTVSYVYDELDRVKKICYAYSGGNPTAAYEYTYDANGYLHKFTDRVSGQVTVYKYTQSGRLREYYVNDLDPSKKSQTGVYNDYDSEGRIKSQEIYRDYAASGVFDLAEAHWLNSYEYNDDGTLKRFSNSLDSTYYSFNYSYDDFGRLTSNSNSLYTRASAEYGFGKVNYEYTYSSKNGSTSLQVLGVSTSYTYGTTVSDTENRSYTYNSAGYITHIYKDGVLQYSYAYDDLGQLTRENNLPAGRTYLYTYDKDGNILSKTECSYTTSGTPSIIGVTSFTYGNGRSDVLKKITLPNGQTFTPTHDIVGNPSSVMIENGNTMAAMWSYGRRLTMVVAGPDMFTYDYNADGIRTTKTVNGVKHTYALSGTTILNEEWTENGVQHLLMYVYDANGSPVGMVYRNSTMAANATEEYLFVKNIQGDILYVYSSTGNKLVSYVYDAWGNIISTTYSNGGGTSAARFNPFTYRGYYRDSETGMYYLNSRYYNPKMGRFISADAYVSTGQGLLGYNMYAYCLNNPVNYVDPSGTCAHQAIGDCETCRLLILSGDDQGIVSGSGKAQFDSFWDDYISVVSKKQYEEYMSNYDSLTAFSYATWAAGLIPVDSPGGVIASSISAAGTFIYTSHVYMNDPYLQGWQKFTMVGYSFVTNLGSVLCITMLSSLIAASSITAPVGMVIVAAASFAYVSITTAVESKVRNDFYLRNGYEYGI